MQERFIGLFGFVVILFIAYAISRDRKAIRWSSVFLGIALQFTFAIAILGIPSLGVPGLFRFVFVALNALVTNMVEFTGAGSKFVFGPLAEIKDPWGFVFAFRALPTIIFFSALMSGLYHLGVLQKVVKAFAFVMQKTMKTSGAESLSGAANIFMGQTEAPLLIRPFIKNMTQSEIFCVMVAGMATIAAGVEGAYVGLLGGRISDIAGHLITASVISSIGAIIVSKMIFPEKEIPQTAAGMNAQIEPVADAIHTNGEGEAVASKPDVNVIEAISRGASDGVSLALNVAGMLIAFISLIAILDAMIGKVGIWMNLADPISFATILAFICRPVAFLLGIPWSETAEVARLIGEKVVLNEFVAFVHLAEVAEKLTDRTVLIASYALCGFANFSSIGIQIAGIGGMAPEQKPTIARLGLLAVLAGNLASFLSACIAGLLY